MNASINDIVDDTLFSDYLPPLTRVTIMFYVQFAKLLPNKKEHSPVLKRQAQKGYQRQTWVCSISMF